TNSRIEPRSTLRPGTTSSEASMSINRRSFLRNVVGAASTAALAGAAQHASAQQPLPPAETSGIDHIVVVMMENRSFDHFLGWLPGAHGQQAGLSYTDTHGEVHPTYRLATFVGCSHPDPDHSYAGGRSEIAGGEMNGWLQTSTNDTF